MKKLIISIAICFLLLCMPLVTSDCQCNTSKDLTQSTSSLGSLSSEDIKALQKQGELEGWTFIVGENTATQYPLEELCGLVEPDLWWEQAHFDPCLPTQDLPDRFDWREIGGCTPVKNQGHCGSCWAFGTVGPLECAILIHDGREVDISEQWLVSCNRDGWGCNGGWFAHDYHQWKTDWFNDTGAVLEENFPYEASNVPCNGPYPHPYRIDDWTYIGMHPGIPFEDCIKQAILDYGPVSVAVSVNAAFGAYTGGIFNNHSTGSINHAVVLVGWDDNQGSEGVWFLRNSWGPGWGEDGYMRIEYGCSKVGYSACYVDYPPKTAINIRGGLLGIGVDIQNVAAETLTDIDWSISVTGGLFDDIDICLINHNEVLPSGRAIRRRIPRFGLGPLEITVTAEASNAGKTIKSSEAFLLGLLVIPVE
jgi:C1A family cysteine protease